MRCLTEFLQIHGQSSQLLWRLSVRSDELRLYLCMFLYTDLFIFACMIVCCAMLPSMGHCWAMLSTLRFVCPPTSPLPPAASLGGPFVSRNGRCVVSSPVSAPYSPPAQSRPPLPWATSCRVRDCAPRDVLLPSPFPLTRVPSRGAVGRLILNHLAEGIPP